MIGKIFLAYLGLISVNQSFGYISDDDINISETCSINDVCTETKSYTLIDNALGKSVQNIDLKEQVPQNVIDQIIADVQKHKLLIFKNQGSIPGKRQVAIGEWFGPTEKQTPKGHQHTKSPHKHVLRVSNDIQEGNTKVGTAGYGWHIDGSYFKKPSSHGLYHIIECTSSGDTYFADLANVIDGLDDKTKDFWFRLFWKSRRVGGFVHPLVYPHPLSGEPTMVFNLGMKRSGYVDFFVLDFGTSGEKVYSEQETDEIAKSIAEELDKYRVINTLLIRLEEFGMMIDSFQYVHKWESGDLIITDNLAVAHMASPGTQYNRAEVGLRVMHRVTVHGKYEPIHLKIPSK